MNPIQEDILMHYGVKRRSGRYPWGSGENPYQHGGDFLSRVEELQRLGKSEKEIAEEIGLSTTDLRMQIRVAKHERRALQADRAKSLREDGKTLDEIAEIMGFKNDSSVRALLNENTAQNKNKAQETAEILKKELDAKGALDVGAGVEYQLGVSSGVLQEALFILETEGYNRYGVGVPQVNDPKKRTITPVISKPDIDQKDVYQNLDLVKSVGEYHSTDGGTSWDKREYPASIDSSRVKIRYGDEGGTAKDGVIEIRLSAEGQPGQAEGQLVEPIQGDQPPQGRFSGFRRTVRQISGGSRQKAVENHQRRGSGKAGQKNALEMGGDASAQQPSRKGEDGTGGGEGDEQVKRQKHGSGNLLSRRHIGGGFFLCHGTLLC